MTKQKLPSHLKRVNGFTLIEVIISITLLAFLMLGVYSIVDHSTATKDQVIAEDRELLSKESALARIENDLSQVFSPLYFDIEEKKVANPNSYDSPDKTVRSTKGIPIYPINTEQKDELIFLSHGNRRVLGGTKQSNYMWIRYHVGNSPNPSGGGPVISLFRQIKNSNIYHPRDIDWSSVKDYEILKNIKDLEFTYYSTEKEKFVSSLKDFGDKEVKIPKAIKLTLNWVSPTGEDEYTEKILRPIWIPYDAKKDSEEVAKTNLGADVP